MRLWFACRGKGRLDHACGSSIPSFTSPKILLMTVLFQGMGSLNPFQNPKPSLPQMLPQKEKHLQLFKMTRKVGKGFYSTAPDGPDGQ